MVYKNFSEKYKKVLIESENKIKEIGVKDLRAEDVFIEIIKTAENALKDLFNLYGINEKLILDIMEK